MSRILVIGGYGGFGARLSRRLLAAGHEVLVAGRSLAKAEAFCAGLPGGRPLEAGRENGIGLVMARYRPDLVIDAAGPFQASGYTVPEACIAMRIPYLDLADARDFVTGMSTLDAAAKAAGVPVIAGASSMSALSGAVVRQLVVGMEQVHAVDMAISASNRASAGPSVAAAILSYVGRSVELWRGKRWTTAYGWQEMRRERFAFRDGEGLGARWVGIADVADHDIIPDALPGRPSVTFRAGTELGFQMGALWLASWPVRWRWLKSLRGCAPWLLPLYRLTLGLGSDRSAMNVTVVGEVAGRRVERRWTLVANKGDGREVPTLAVELLAGDILAGRVPPGARHSWHEVALDRFERLFSRLSIRHETNERELPPPFYARVMGSRFAVLPIAVRTIHEVAADAGAEGVGLVERGRGWLARLIGAIMGFPPAGEWPLHVAFAERNGVEKWTRDFGGYVFSSELSEADGLVVERFGPLRFAFALESDADGLEMRLRHWSCLGVSLPRALSPNIAAREWEEEGLFRFDVRVSMPLVGEVVHYSGRLSPIL